MGWRVSFPFEFKQLTIYNLKFHTICSRLMYHFNMIIALIQVILLILLYKPIINSLHNINYQKRIDPPIPYEIYASLTDSIPQKL